MSTYSKKYGGTVYLSFNGELITLTAKDLTTPRFSYKAESFYDAVSLGKIADAITGILKKFDSTVGGVIKVADVTEKIDSLKNIPVLGQILTSELVIMEFTIQPPSTKDATDGKYAFGIGLKLTENNTLGPVTLDGVSFSIELNQTG